MKFLFLCLLAIGGYFYYRKLKNRKSDDATENTTNVSLGTIVQIPEEQLKKVAEETLERPGLYEVITKLEQTYGSKLREGLNALISNLLLNKDRQTLSGKKNQGGRNLAQIIATIDDKYILPSMPKDSEDYVIWWSSIVLILKGLILNNKEYPKQAMLLNDIINDVESVNELLANNGVLEKIENGEQCNTVLFVSKSGQPPVEIKIKHRVSKQGLNYHEILGGYKYFGTDLSSDPIMELIEMYIASVAIIQLPGCSIWRCDLEKYNLPSVVKH